MKQALITINLRDYSLDPYDYFPKIHQAIASKLVTTGIAAITLENFKLELLPHDEPYFNEVGIQQAIVSVDSNGQQYQQLSTYVSIPNERIFLGRIQSSKVAELFNKILQDQGSHYRLKTIGVKSNAHFQVVMEDARSSFNSDSE